MIDWIKSAELNKCTVEWLKARFERFPKSEKKVIRVCNNCKDEKPVYFYAVTDLCLPCSKQTPAYKLNASKVSKKYQADHPEARKSHSEFMIQYFIDNPDAGKEHGETMKQHYINNPESREAVSERSKKQWSDPVVREKISGENCVSWQGGISFGKYCPKFNNNIKQYIRDKYNNCDYISGLPARVCNPDRKLDVHHVDYNKEQGCDDHEWRLIPLSRKNHAMTNHNRQFWNILFTYSLQYDDTYYENEPVDIWSAV